MFDRERAIQPHENCANFFALGRKIFDSLYDGLAAGAHDDYDAFGFGMTEVIEQIVLSPCDLSELVHGLLRDTGDRRVIWVHRFTHLEVHIWVLGGAA